MQRFFLNMSFPAALISNIVVKMCFCEFSPLISSLVNNFQMGEKHNNNS